MNFFKKKTAEQDIKDGLEKAKHKLIEHENEMYYHNSMTTYYRLSIQQLKKIAKEGSPCPQFLEITLHEDILQEMRELDKKDTGALKLIPEYHSNNSI